MRQRQRGVAVDQCGGGVIIGACLAAMGADGGLKPGHAHN